MSLPATLTVPVFIFECGPTAAQQAWLAKCTPQAYAAFLVSAPVHLYVTYAVLPDGRIEHRFVPTVHGIRIGAQRPHASAEEALEEGLTCQSTARADLLGKAVSLDLDALTLRFQTEHYASPQAHDVKYFGQTISDISRGPGRSASRPLSRMPR